MEKIESRDGTVVVFDQLGEGAPIIVVAGASCDRIMDAPIAQALAERFTVLNYDRRGRGDSGDKRPYAVAREVEDLQALLDAAGGSATVLGLSSGAVLAAEAAASRLPIERLIMWEPPFSVDPDGVSKAKTYSARLAELLAADRRDDALVHFMTHVGVPEEMIAGIRRSPYWQSALDLAPTLAYDAAIMGDTKIPAGRFGGINASTLVLAGSRSPEFMRLAAEQVATTIPGARHHVLDGQDHNVAADVIAPVVFEFTGR